MPLQVKAYNSLCTTSSDFWLVGQPLYPLYVLVLGWSDPQIFSNWHAHL